MNYLLAVIYSFTLHSKLLCKLSYIGDANNYVKVSIISANHQLITKPQNDNYYAQQFQNNL